MPDDRMIHRKALRGEKVARLTDFERGVWLAYILISDDYGVMRFSAQMAQEAIWLESRPRKAVQRALEAIKGVGLVDTFVHQGRVYCFQPDWQTWQSVRHPRATIHPCPPEEALTKCDTRTAALFQQHSNKAVGDVPQNSGKVSETFQPLAGAGTRETLTLTANANGQRLTHAPKPCELSPSDRPDLSERAGRFLERYAAMYARLRKGARYLGKPTLDFQEALQLVSVWDDERLDKLATVFLTTDHEFAERGSRTMAQFRSMASWCDGRLAEAGLV